MSLPLHRDVNEIHRMFSFIEENLEGDNYDVALEFLGDLRRAMYASAIELEMFDRIHQLLSPSPPNLKLVPTESPGFSVKV